MKICKKCNKQKSLDDFYSHPLTDDLRMGKCKICILGERSSERGREIQRRNDKIRQQKQGRRDKKLTYNNEYVRKYPEKKKANNKVTVFLKSHPELKPKVSSISGEGGLIHLHHFDYSKPNEVVACTPLEHKRIHMGELQFTDSQITVFPF